MAVKALVFDIGGVLGVTPPTGWQDRWVAALGLDLGEMARRLEPSWSRGSTGAVTVEQVEQQIGDALELDEASRAAFMNYVWSEYLGTLNEDLAAYFTRLRPRYKTGIYTQMRQSSSTTVQPVSRERAPWA
jgi:hypothetical protein